MRPHPQQTERVSAIWGAPFSTGADAQQSAGAFLSQYAGLFGVDSQDLNLIQTRDLMQGKFVLLGYQQTWHGLAVEGGTLALLVRREPGFPLVLANATLVPVPAEVRMDLTLSAADALQVVRAADPALARLESTSVFLEHGGALVRTWRILGMNDPARGQEPRAVLYHVDAASGTILSEERALLDGALSGTVLGYRSAGTYPDDVDHPPVVLPLRGAHVIDDTAAVFTDVAGAFQLAYPAGMSAVLTIDVDFDGPWANVQSFASAMPDLTYTVTANPGQPLTVLMNSAPSEFNVAQTNAIQHITTIADYINSLEPDYPFAALPATAWVNVPGACNAYYVPGQSTLLFLRAAAAGSCPNTAYSTIIYHEFGHFVIDSISPFAATARDYHEGMADLNAALYLNQSCVGADFFGPATGCLRDVQNDVVMYPAYHSDPHIRGLALAGAFWQTKLLLENTLGPEAALQLTRQLYLAQIMAGSKQISPQVMVDVLTLDDDDASLANGTPHSAAIIGGFGARNLAGYIPTGEIVDATPPPDNPFVAFAQPFRECRQTGTTHDLSEGIQDITVQLVTQEMLAPSDVAISCNYTGAPPGATPCPTVQSITPVAPGVFTVHLSQSIPPGGCTTLLFTNTGETLKYEYLPGDLDYSGQVSTFDVLSLVFFVNSDANQPSFYSYSPSPLLRYDVNRSGAVDTLDVLRLVQLANGENTTQAWSGASLVPCSN
ncbi:MAG TPA: hypothetical protein VGM03_20300 [Phycisphaerae bacterium]